VSTWITQIWWLSPFSSGATVTDRFSADLSDVTIRSIEAAGGAVSTATLGPLAGVLVDTVDLPAGASLTYVVTGRVPNPGRAALAAKTVLTSSASVELLPEIQPDIRSTNNRASDSDVVVLAAVDGSGLFYSPEQTLGERASLGVALGDVDGDGDLDAVVTNSQGDGNRVWFNDGSGGMVDSGQELGSEISVAVALGDVDGDGDLDAVIVSNGPNRVWINDGSGTFSANGPSLGNGTGRDLGLADFDGDGDLDVLLSNDRNARLWLNNGDGQFSKKGPTLDAFTDVAIGDLDGDGDLDAFVQPGNFGNQRGRVWLNNGEGLLVDSGQRLGTGRNARLAIADLDADGDLDVFSASREEGIRVWRNDGNATFVDGGQQIGGVGATGVELADLDGDGDIDAFVTRAGSFPPGVPNQTWLNDGAGHFTLGSRGVGAGSSNGVALGDLDGDGDIDAFVTNRNESNRVWLNAQDLVDLSVDIQSARTSVGLGESIEYVLTVENAGPRDAPAARVLSQLAPGLTNTVLLDVSATGGARSNLALGPFSGPFDDTAALPVGASLTYVFTGKVVPDDRFTTATDSLLSIQVVVNAGQGVADLDLGNNKASVSDVILLLAEKGTAQLQLSDQRVGIGATTDLVVADIDSDGDLDLFITRRLRKNRLWLNDGRGQFTRRDFAVEESDSFAVAAGDVDGDGSLDLWVVNRREDDTLWSWNGTELIRRSLIAGTGRSRDVALGDVDGDGDLDAIVANRGEPNQVWLNDGSGNFADSGQQLGDHASLAIALGDLDGDGDLDAFEANAYGQANRVWRNDGRGQFSVTKDRLGNADSTDVALGDVDGDGDLDAVVSNRDGGDRIWLNDGGGRFVESGQVIGSGRSNGVALGDMDADGDVDLVIANGTGAGNPLWINDGSGRFSDRGPSFGVDATNQIVLGDIDGDGDLDAITANSFGTGNHVWFHVDAEVAAHANDLASWLARPVPMGPALPPARLATTGQAATGLATTGVASTEVSAIGMTRVSGVEIANGAALSRRGLARALPGGTQRIKPRVTGRPPIGPRRAAAARTVFSLSLAERQVDRVLTTDRISHGSLRRRLKRQIEAMADALTDVAGDGYTRAFDAVLADWDGSAANEPITLRSLGLFRADGGQVLT